MTGALLTGSFPRSDELIEATRAFDRKRLGPDALEEGFLRDARAVTAVEAAVGLQYVDDGLLPWEDLLRPLAQALRGVKLGALTRWYDNNTFYRKPIVTETLDGGSVVAERYYRSNILPKGGAWRAVLPGPYTFARLAEDKAYGNSRDLILDLSGILAKEAKRLAGRGYGLIQISEPSLATDPPDRDLRAALQGGLANVVRGLGAKTLLHTYFGDPTPILDLLLDLPVDYLGIDFQETPVERVAKQDFDRGLVVGIVDARNSLLEDPKEIVDFAQRVRSEVEPRDLLLAPNTDLEYLPRGVAEAKLKALGRAAAALREA